MPLILKEINNECMVISINRPEKRNALNNEMYQAMADALNEAAVNEQIKAVLLRSEGEHFTAGNDLAQFANVSDEDHLGETAAFMEALRKLPMPIVAQVKGMAVGIGTTLLLHCDLVYCDETAIFSLPFINLALVPEYASSLLLPTLVGHRKAAQWLMLGESFGAEDALKTGLINEIIATDKLQLHCQNILQTLCSKPRLAMLHTKALMKSNTEQIKMQMNDEMDVFVSQLNTDAAQEAFAAFLEKRPPNSEKYR